MYKRQLQDRGFKVALVTDGRMSGASGKVPAAIHVVPEAAVGGALAKVRSGDIITLDATKGSLSIDISESDFSSREAVVLKEKCGRIGFGRDLFTSLRLGVQSAEAGAGAY